MDNLDLREFREVFKRVIGYVNPIDGGERKHHITSEEQLERLMAESDRRGAMRRLVEYGFPDRAIKEAKKDDQIIVRIIHTTLDEY